MSDQRRPARSRPGSPHRNARRRLGLGASLAALLAAHTAAAASHSVLYSFTGGVDGRFPNPVAMLDGTIYGTTYSGGSGHGTVFKLSASGVHSILHKFSGAPDADMPLGGPVTVGQVLFATTAGGGAHNSGTVYRIEPHGIQILYSFTHGADGSTPIGSLLAVGDMLYGTAGDGGLTGGACGSGGCGTVFSLTKAGVLTVLYSFKGGNDGSAPNGGPIFYNGALYGTTRNGGTVPCKTYECGTVFKVTLSGTEQVLFRFAGGPEGGFPNAGLVRIGNTLIGTTAFGGQHQYGTVFKLPLAGQETVLHQFTDGADGGFPDGGLLSLGGLLYGETQNGGAGLAQACCGTVFSITPSGTESIVQDFTGSPDVDAPTGNLVANGSQILGVSEFGGTHGYGTVYAVSP